MIRNLILFIIIATFGGCFARKKVEQVQTICNPLNLSYRFRPEAEEVSRREAADPTMIVFNGEYYLFASKTGGYWHSADLVKWDLVETDQIPTEDYAPAAVVLDGAVYFIASNGINCPIYKSSDPKLGNWEVVCDTFPYAVTDPAFFLDDDKRLYFYWGCSNEDPIMGVELDPKTFMPLGQPDSLIFANTARNGWENPGDYNELTEQAPWIEGPWVTKHDNRYYLQYAGPGTEYKSYADGVYVSDSPLGKFEQANQNPMAYKPGGFINGIGHGSTFTDKFGNYWHVGTMSISVKHPFERRLGLNPLFFDDEGNMYAATGRADYPFIVPQSKLQSPSDIDPGWNLLSYNKAVEVSSQLFDHPGENAVNEDVRTYWSAQTGKKGEWLSIDLEENYEINAVQINFAEQNADIYGRKTGVAYQYLLEFSVDGKKWHVLADKSENNADLPHDFVQMNESIDARYIRITNIQMPSGNFAISGLRVFGKGYRQKPENPADFKVVREADRRVVNLRWKKVPGAVGYRVQYGVESEHRYLTYLVYGDNSLKISSLNTASVYEFQVVAFNENGQSESSQIVRVE